MSGSLRSLRTASGWGIGNGFFTEQRLLLCGSIAVVGYAIGLARKLLGYEWFLAANGKQRCIDFTTMWVSGIFAGSSDPARMYDASAWPAAWKSLTGLEGCMLAHGHTSYPPTLLFFTYPLGLMPYSIAFVVWMTATLLLYLAAVYVILPRPVVVIAALTAFTAIFNILIGQNGFVTAGLIGLSLVFMERRPWLSGIILGLLSYKPQFGILFPFALLASRNWRALLSATTMSLILGVAAAIVFGYQGWLSFVISLVDRSPALLQQPWALVSIFGFLQSAGASTKISWVLHLAFAAIVAATVYTFWAKPIPFSLKAALLCIGSVTVTPYVLLYDLCILSIAVAFLVKDGLERGFLPGERAVMLTCWVGLIMAGTPVPIIVCVLLLLLVFRRIAFCPGDAPTGPGLVIHTEGARP